MTTTPPAGATRTSGALAQPLLVLAAGLAVALGLAAYGNLHDPTGKALVNLGFDSPIRMKAWLTTIALGFAGVQLVTALAMYGRLGDGAQRAWIGPAHRLSGLLAVLVSLPVAAQCLWGLGFQTYDTRVAVHSVLGCAFYGAFAAKMLTLRTRGGPRWLLPVLGATVLSVLAGLWLTASLWYFRS